VPIYRLPQNPSPGDCSKVFDPWQIRDLPEQDISDILYSQTRYARFSKTSSSLVHFVRSPWTAKIFDPLHIEDVHAQENLRFSIHGKWNICLLRRSPIACVLDSLRSSPDL